MLVRRMADSVPGTPTGAFSGKIIGTLEKQKKLEAGQCCWSRPFGFSDAITG
jgi:hypothetical protein